MKDYEELKAFWNDTLGNAEPEAYAEKAFHDETFDRLLAAGLAGAKTALDYGCGSGWGLFEMYYANRDIKGLGVDPSQNGVAYANGCAALSGLRDTLAFRTGDESSLPREAFDFILTVNVLDIVPQDVCERVLAALHGALKAGRRMLVCLNPEFTHEELTGMIGMEKRDDAYYKNGILRARSLTRAQWTALFRRYFTVEETANFALTEREKKYPRVAYLLRKA